MNKICFLFPGQGSQKINMGADFVKLSKRSKKIFETASDVFQCDLLKISTNFTQEELNNSKYNQPLILATSIAAFELLKEIGIFPDFVVGHSLGQYSALYAANIFPLEEIFQILKLRIKAIEDMPKTDTMSMCAIIGASQEEIQNACESSESYVASANFNSPKQTVISGTKKGVEEVILKLKGKFKRSVFLPVSYAFHSQLMLPAAELFKQSIKDFQPQKMSCGMFSNVTGNLIEPEEDIKNLMVKHLISPVLFVQILFNLQNESVNTFVELGQGNTLTNFVKQTLKEKETLNISDKDSFLKTVSCLQ